MTSIDILPNSAIPNPVASPHGTASRPHPRREEKVPHLRADRLGMIHDAVDTTQVKDHVEFTGPSADSATAFHDPGIVLEQTRSLIAETGQWMQEDPIGFQAGDANLRP